MEKNLNIISLNIPFPPDYGGMVDTFYRVKNLAEAGIKIHLHCFRNKRQNSEELEVLCETVHYYPRRMGFFRQFSLLPFIVNSRISDSLKSNLLQNDFPILFDGLHTAYLLDNKAFKKRKKYVRLHNIEHNYYRSMAKHESNPVIKAYFFIESLRLRSFEKLLTCAEKVFAISAKDNTYFDKIFRNSICIPPFHPFKNLVIKPGSGRYILYHGDLSVNENREIAIMLIKKVFPGLKYNCIIAGRKPGLMLKKHIIKYENIGLVPDPDDHELMELIINAHVNVIPAGEPDGFKIKLLFSLYAGRYCVINSAMARGSGIHNSVIIADTPEEIKDAVSRCMELEFTKEMVLEREKVLVPDFDCGRNTEILEKTIFSENQ